MNYVDEYRDGEAAQKLVRAIDRRPRFQVIPALQLVAEAPLACEAHDEFLRGLFSCCTRRK